MNDDTDLHSTLLTLDSHIDIPWPGDDDPFESSPNRRVDLVKMRQGGLWAGCFAAYTGQGRLDRAAHAAATARAFDMLDRIAGIGAITAEGGIGTRACTTADAIEQAHRDRQIAIVPAIENAYAFGEDLSVVAAFRARGACYVTLTHNGHNAIADSAIPRRDLGDDETRHGGLSAFGREAVAEMNRCGMLVDVSHLSRQSMLQAAEHSSTPVVATHSCVRALCDHRRNLDDSQLDVLRETGGLIQITAMPSFLRLRGTIAEVGVSELVDHIDYVVRRIGVAHVGISSDFDGGGALRDWSNAGESANVTAELVRRGYGRSEIEAFWSGNFLRLMRRAEAEARPVQSAAPNEPGL
ncbi:membrane dipeptidase [Lichenicola cladoniae]|uniref:Membrane dipeptidase n=1 Tax=Lichenicola cladoniae TaxID=1484109 RepID=A0A6M8HPI5_9PROT|nr:dipeptidase [Lichenicola cladoniae]NPD66526.1 membrane dipeptidase [Acetobacteraceae bacterium]QKE90258.1 membrane dipeptidase [Lichenicola cladoniae]